MKLREASWPRAIQLASGLALLGMAAASLSYCVNLILIEGRTKFFAGNDLPMLHRNWFTISLLLSLALPWILTLPWLIKKPLAEVSSKLWLWGHRASPLILLGLAAPMLDRGAYSKDPLTALLLTLVVGLLAALLLTRSFDYGDWPVKLRSPLQKSSSLDWLPTGVVVSASVLLIVHFAVYTLMRHYRMESRAHDLAIFDNMMWSLIHGEGFQASPTLGPDGNHLARHTTFSAVLLAPFYALRQQADALLVIQAVMVGSTPIPIYLMARRILGSAWVACALGVSYALYAPVQGPVFYDFHFLTTAQPLIAWVFYLLLTERTLALAIVTAVALAWREDVGAVLAGGGALFFLSGIHRSRAFAFSMICAVYFLVVKFLVIPFLGHSSVFSDVYKELWPEGQRNFGGVLQTLLTNPAYTFETLLDKNKLIFVLQLFVPVLFFPIRHRFAWVALLPAAVFTLLATKYPPVYQISFQYTAYWGPSIFLATALVFHDRFTDRGKKSALGANAVALLLVGAIAAFHFGSVFESKAFRGGFSGVRFSWTEADAEQLAAFRRLAAMVPPDASIVATETEVPHLSNRRFCYTMRVGYYDAEYMLVKKSEIRGDRSGRSHFQHALGTGRYGFVKSDGPFSLWKRDHSTEGNEAAKRSLGLSRPGARKPAPK